MMMRFFRYILFNALHLLFSLMEKVTKKSSRRSAGKMKSVITPVQSRALVGLTDLESFTKHW